MNRLLFAKIVFCKNRISQLSVFRNINCEMMHLTLSRFYNVSRATEASEGNEREIPEILDICAFVNVIFCWNYSSGHCEYIFIFESQIAIS